jgi:hypothetical protein
MDPHIKFNIKILQENLKNKQNHLKF